MTLDVKALRALLAKHQRSMDALNAVPPHESPLSEMMAAEQSSQRLASAMVAAAPDLLTLAEAVRDLAPMLKEIDETCGRLALTRSDALRIRRVIAILDTPPRAAGDGR